MNDGVIGVLGLARAPQDNWRQRLATDERMRGGGIGWFSAMAVFQQILDERGCRKIPFGGLTVACSVAQVGTAPSERAMRCHS